MKYLKNYKKIVSLWGNLKNKIIFKYDINGFEVISDWFVRRALVLKIRPMTAQQWLCR